MLAAGEGTRGASFLAALSPEVVVSSNFARRWSAFYVEHHLQRRVERLIPRERVLVVVSPDHRDEVAAQLAHWPAQNVIFQPKNRDTASGILLPLAPYFYR